MVNYRNDFMSVSMRSEVVVRGGGGRNKNKNQEEKEKHTRRRGRIKKIK